jgi:hypothetical protein
MKTQNDILYYMKTTCSTLICLTALALNSALSQQPPAPTPPPAPQPPSGPTDQSTFASRLQAIIAKASTNPSSEPVLTKFNLDFPGGTPKRLVAAIEKATDRPLNAIIPNEFADTALPALKMSSVSVVQLFQALEAASRKTETYQFPNSSSYQMHQTSYGFKTEGQASDDSIWHFYVDKPNPPPPSLQQAPKVSRFYSLAPYLDRGLSVDDITTAIETGWKMLGDKSPPTISFHKDTKLLIAVGEERKLETISDVLKALEPPRDSRGGRVRFGGGDFQPPAPRTNAPAPAAK